MNIRNSGGEDPARGAHDARRRDRAGCAATAADGYSDGYSDGYTKEDRARIHSSLRLAMAQPRTRPEQGCDCSGLASPI